jgi:hypothetical protein
LKNRCKIQDLWCQHERPFKLTHFPISVKKKAGFQGILQRVWKNGRGCKKTAEGVKKRVAYYFALKTAFPNLRIADSARYGQPSRA